MRGAEPKQPAPEPVDGIIPACAGSSDSLTFDDLEYAFWKEHYEQAGVPMDDYDIIEIDKLLKPKLDEWLSRHAGSYGFKYSSKRE